MIFLFVLSVFHIVNIVDTRPLGYWRVSYLEDDTCLDYSKAVEATEIPNTCFQFQDGGWNQYSCDSDIISGYRAYDDKCTTPDHHYDDGTTCSEDVLVVAGHSIYTRDYCVEDTNLMDLIKANAGVAYEKYLEVEDCKAGVNVLERVYRQENSCVDGVRYTSNSNIVDVVHYDDLKCEGGLLGGDYTMDNSCKYIQERGGYIFKAIIINGEAPEPPCDELCVHGYCDQVVENRRIEACHCDNGWKGEYCDIEDTETDDDDEEDNVDPDDDEEIQDIGELWSKYIFMYDPMSNTAIYDKCHNMEDFIAFEDIGRREIVDENTVSLRVECDESTDKTTLYSYQEEECGGDEEVMDYSNRKCGGVFGVYRSSSCSNPYRLSKNKYASIKLYQFGDHTELQCDEDLVYSSVVYNVRKNDCVSGAHDKGSMRVTCVGSKLTWDTYPDSTDCTGTKSSGTLTKECTNMADFLGGITDDESQFLGAKLISCTYTDSGNMIKLSVALLLVLFFSFF